MALAKKHCSDDRLYFKFLQYSLRLSHDSDNFTLYHPSHVSHFFYLPDFGRFWQSRDQPQPGSFFFPGTKREDPGNEVGIITASVTSHSNQPGTVRSLARVRKDAIEVKKKKDKKPWLILLLFTN